MCLQDRVAVVTGGSSGIGRGIAERLAEEGARVVIADTRREPKSGERYPAEDTRPTDEHLAAEYGVESHYVETDVANEADVEGLIAETVGTFGGIDVLVNNAGVSVPGTTEDLSRADWEMVIEINLTAQFLTAKHAKPHLVESNAGRMINISSVSALVGGGGAPYSATKAGVVNLTRDLAVEFAPVDVTVNAILPGVVKTPMQDENDDETVRREAERTPLSRTGEPRDVANAVRFFASDEAAWITGASLLVDGGYMAGR